MAATRFGSYLLIRGARQLLTLRGAPGPRRGPAMRDLGVIEDGAVLIRDGIIVALGPSRRIENLREARQAKVVDATGRVVAPGFVDSHTHLVCGPPRLNDYELLLAGATYQEIAARGGGIMFTVRAVRERPASRLEAEAARTLDGFIRHGATTIEVKSGYGLDDAAERKTLRLVRKLNGRPADLVPTYLGAHIVPAEWHGRADEYVAWTCAEMMPRIRRAKLAVFADVYCEEKAFTLEQSRRYLAAARALGFELKIHTDQFTRSGGAQLAVEFGATSADHLDRSSREDIRALAGSNVICTLLPGAVLHLGQHDYPPARAMIEAGAAVALATDYNPGTSPTFSMPMILSLACSQMRMTPAEAFTGATINGAWAVRRADVCGSIEAGKAADLVVFDAPDYREIPYHFGVNPVAMTIKSGSIVYDARRLTWQGN